MPNDKTKLTAINLDIMLSERHDGLGYSTDALLLSAFVRGQRHGVAAEFGSGTGAVSLLCAKKEKFAHIHAVEIQADYAALTAENAKRNGLEDKITVHHCDIRQWKMQDLDCVFSNPPYMVKEGIASPNDGRQIARHEMNGTLSDFCASAARVLRYGGMFFCVCRPDRMTDLLCGMRHSALEPKRMILVSQSVRHAPSLFLCEAKKGAKPALQLPPVLFLYDQNGDMTDAYRYITEHGEFPV